MDAKTISPTSQAPVTPPTIQVILDTNIIKKIIDPFSVNEFSIYLRDIFNRNGTFVISDFTCFELLRGANLKSEAVAFPIINVVVRLFVSTTVLYASARLETLYKMEGIQPESIDIGDKIIGATALLNSALVLTANGRDFPIPYFIEIERKIIEFKDKNKRTKCIPISLLKPDYEILVKRFNERT